MGLQCSLMLTEIQSKIKIKKLREANSRHLREVLHLIAGCDGNPQGSYWPTHSFQVIHSLDVYTSHSFTPLSPDLLPSFPHWWRVHSTAFPTAISLSNYLSINTRRQMSL